jgi:hypothetical protein
VTRALIPMPGRGSAAVVAVDVYRNGDEVVVIGEGEVHQRNPFGGGEIVGQASFKIVFPDLRSYNGCKAAAFNRNRVMYARMIGVCGIDDDAEHAPALPAHLADDDATETVLVEAEDEAAPIRRFPLLSAVGE